MTQLPVFKVRLLKVIFSHDKILKKRGNHRSEVLFSMIRIRVTETSETMHLVDRLGI